METLELLGAALGLAALAGVNLYLTVLVTGLAVRFGWLSLADKYESLSVLADPVILWVAGTLFVLEFFADKVPWVDTLWDSVHTVIRPVGAAMLAISVLGETNAVYDVVVGLLGGGLALTSHAVKSGTRVVANLSPEPFSNTALSLGEDALVLGGLALVAFEPIAALVAVVVFAGLAWWLLPKLFRAGKASLWFLWRRAAWAIGAGRKRDGSGADVLPEPVAAALANWHGGRSRPLWAAPCVVARVPGVPANRFGWLLVNRGADGIRLDFAVRDGGKPNAISIPHEGSIVVHRKGVVCDEVRIQDPVDDRVVRIFRFDRSRRDLAAGLEDALRAPDPEGSGEAAREAQPAGVV